MAVGLGERLRHRALRQTRGLAEHLADGVDVEVAEFATGEHLLQVKHLDEVELQVADVALVVAHGGQSRTVTPYPICSAVTATLCE